MAAKTVKFITIAANKDLTDVTVNPEAAPTSTPRQGGFTLRNRVNFANVAAANKKLWIIDDATFSDDAINNFRILEVPERTYVKDLTVFAVASETQPMFKVTGAKASNASITASDLDAMTLSFGADQNKKPTSSASYSAASHLVTLTTVNAEGVDGYGAVGGDIFGNMKLKAVASDANHPTTASLGNLVFVDTFSKIDSSIASPLEPMQTAKRVGLTANLPAASASGVSANWSVTQYSPGHYFPYGGFVNMKLGPWNTSMSSSIASAKSDAWFSTATAATVALDGVWEFQANCNYVPE